MNKTKKDISIYEGLGGACLLGFLFSTVSSIPSWLTYYKLSSNPPLSPSSLQLHIGEHVQVSSQVFSPKPEVFFIRQKLDRALLDLPNTQKHQSWYHFFLDPKQEITVEPTPQTLWITYHKLFPTPLSLKESLFRVLTLPLHLFRYFLGLRYSSGSVTVETSVKPGDNVFIVGLVSLLAGRIELTPDVISVSKEEYMALSKSEIMRWLVVPLMFLIGSLACYLKVKKLERNAEVNSKVYAVLDMKCKICNVNQACLVLRPCNHLCVCDTCHVEACPVCGKGLEGTMKVFNG